MSIISLNEIKIVHTPTPNQFKDDLCLKEMMPTGL